MREEKGVKITERGWAGHLMFAGSCRFRRNTLLEYKDKKWIVSTVGAYYSSDKKMDTIGHNRWYETMAFVGIEQGGYIDADVYQQIDFDSEWGMWGESWDEILEKYPHPDNHANDMHEKVVLELMLRITEE